VNEVISLGPVLGSTLLAVGLLMAVTSAVLTGYRVPRSYAAALAVVRGAAQLAAVSLILGAVITSGTWVAVALGVMFLVASVTATRRLGWSWAHLAMVGSSMAAGIVLSLLIVFATGSIELTGRYALAIGGIVIGNSMTIAALAGRRFNEAVIDQWDLVEGWLALGARPRQATSDMARRAVASSLIPSIDQTKTTGLVTLPGAFVGAIFGGLSPLEAGRFQIVVLASIIAAGSVTAVMLVHMLAPVRRQPARMT
jgi:putative ABC transport system permease protein